MNVSFSINHHIQKYIIGVLLYQEFARFRDLRPPRTDTNLFSYHLKSLIKAGFVQKRDAGYTLSQNGLMHVDRVSTEKMTLRTQPKIITMLLVQNSNGDVLLQKRDKQPYINAWTLPYGKAHIDDQTIMIAAQREAKEKLGIDNQIVRHAGDAYIRVFTEGELLSTTLAHIFRFERDDIETNDTTAWVQPHKLSSYRLAPAVEAIVARSFFNDEHFFEEFRQDWRN
jgi:ADP-ribose pyrophosphatase YjhB (NUDIX family)